MGENPDLVFCFPASSSFSNLVISSSFLLQQVQIYYAGKQRYIGAYAELNDAVVAANLAKRCKDSFSDKKPSPSQVEANTQTMRDAARSSKTGRDASKQKRRQGAGAVSSGNVFTGTHCAY